jgi:uncharacterized protein with FMN-binding domain
MDKSTLLLAAIILAVFGASTAAGHPHWGTFTGIAIVLLAAGLGAGTLPLRSQDFADERTSPTQRISNGLITLSSAAIVAIYAAGYHRTSPAAHRFDSQIPQHRTSATIAIAMLPPAASAGSAAAAPPVSSSAAPAIKKNTKKASTPDRKAAPSTGTDSAGSSASSTSAPSSSSTTNPPAETAAPPAVAAPAAPAKSAYKDGVYLGWGSCRHGDIEASVTIQEGKIALVAISQCLTRYSCGWIAPKIPGGGLPDLPSQAVERQGPKVDYVSGATESSYAFADAVVAALAKATE